MQELKNVTWYVDPNAAARGHLTIQHSYVASLATALSAMGAEVDASWLMGTSAFAFRIFANEIFCPSAMSVFDWNAILAEAVRQAGYDCVYISRLWHEVELEEARRREAHAAIVEGIDRGTPAIVWDVADCEWGVVVGYDDGSYATLTARGEPSTLPLERLGRNGVDVLSVAIPSGPSSRSRRDVVRRSLEAAIAHAEQKEWMDRPKYQDGLAAYDLWASLLEKWALIAKAGRIHMLGTDVPASAACYARHHYSARCYAGDYLRAVAGGDPELTKASLLYDEVASHLKPVWESVAGDEDPEHGTLSLLAQSIRDAKASEREGIECIRRYLAASKQEAGT